MTVGFATAFRVGGDVSIEFVPRDSRQCQRGANVPGTLYIDLEGDTTAHAHVRPDDGTSLQPTSFAFSADRRSLAIGFGPDAVLAGRDFACVLAVGEDYRDFQTIDGDQVYVDFPGYERPECSDGKDNDGDGKVDDRDWACTGDDDDAEALGPTPALSLKIAKFAVMLNARLRGLDTSRLKVSCRKRSRLVARCRAGGAYRGTVTVRRTRTGDEYRDRVSRWRIRSR